MQNYKDLCDFIGRPPPLAPNDKILLLGGLFRPGGNSRNI